MSWLSFQWAKLRGNEAFFQKYSRPISAEAVGKSVALIGNARSLGQTKNGPEIDACDLVVRLNSAPIPSQTSHGTRTDWLAMSMPVSTQLIEERSPSRILWMTRKRKRLPYKLACDPRFHLHDTSMIKAQRETLSASPTTGLMMIDLLLKTEAREIHLYGFDFFASLSLSGDRTAEQVPHDFGSEKEWVLTQMDQDPRLKLHSAETVR